MALIYDHERESPDRTVLHWHFQLQGDPGTEIRLVLRNFDNTWFTEGSTDPSCHNPGSFGEGLYGRYGIPACILELNCNWAAGLQKPPLGADWRLFGRQMREAFREFFG